VAEGFLAAISYHYELSRVEFRNSVKIWRLFSSAGTCMEVVGPEWLYQEYLRSNKRNYLTFNQRRLPGRAAPFKSVFRVCLRKVRSCCHFILSVESMPEVFKLSS
jgi:hypothetical protein